MSRADLLVPEGWKPARGARVTVLASRDEPYPPRGVWRIIDRSSSGPGAWWWAVPVDDEARAWADAHPARIVSRCIDLNGLRLVPPGHKPRPVERKGGRR